MIAGAVLTRKLSVRHVRTQLQISQEDLMREAGVSRTVVWKAETAEKNDRNISLISAYAMLKVFNRMRADLGWELLRVEELDWKVAGEEDDTSG